MVRYKHRISFPKSEKKIALSRLNFEWDDIKIYLRETKNTGAIKQIGPVINLCECTDEMSAFVKECGVCFLS
jgi:hypothetical protein